MAEAKQVADQFTFWNDSLASSIREASSILETTDYDIADLQEALEGVQIDLDHVLTYQTNGKSKVTYDYSLALPNVSRALRLQTKGKRILDSALPVMTAHNASPDAKPALAVNIPHRRIPELPIPKFTGKFSAYTTFINSFHLKFDAYENMSDAERLVHLQALVMGPPAQIIGSLDATDDNYKLALQLLKATYDKPDSVITEIQHEIDILPPATDNPASIRSVYFQLEGLIATLRAHKQNVDENPLLRNIVYSKYPENVILAVSKVKLLSITEFQAAMLNYIDIRDGVQAALDSTKTALRKEPAPLRSATAALFAKTEMDTSNNRSTGKSKDNDSRSSRNTKKIPPCAYCNEKHYSGDCSKVPTLSGRLLAIKNRCTVCFSLRHEKINCPRTIACPFCKQVNVHHRSICPTIFENDKLKVMPTSASTSNTEASNRTVPVRTLNFSHSQLGAHTTLKLSLINPMNKRTYLIRAILDNGSNASYICEKAAKRLGLVMHSYTSLPIGIFMHNSPVNVDSSETTGIITNNDRFQLTIFLNTLPHIPQTCTVFDYDEFKRLYPEYVDYSFVPQADDLPIELVIGSDSFWHLLKPESKIQVASDTFLYSTEFGWALVGKLLDNSPSPLSTFFALKPKQALDKLCALEAIGIADTPLSKLQEEELALNSFYKNLRFTNNRYEIRWPWKMFPPPIENNFPLAVGRLRSLNLKMCPELFEQYDAIIKQQLRDGIIEEVPSNELRKQNVYYLPHRAVITPEKSTKIRIVYDGSARPAKCKNSLNNVIYKGKNILADLVAVFLRFRLHSVVILSDIEKAFLQLLINSLDRDYVRFVWFKKYLSDFSSDNLLLLRFTRVAFGIVASPFLLNATIQHHLITNPNEFTPRMKKDVYADNMCTGVPDYESGLRLYRLTFELFQQCSMNLRSWATNDSSLRQAIPIEQRDDSEFISVLGMLWNPYSDFISVKRYNPIPQDSPLTLRSILSSTASFYDVCGLFSPLQMKAKILIQTVQLRNFEWNTCFDDELHPEWYTIQNDFVAATKRKFPRFLADMDSKIHDYELHIFADASAKGYAAAAYLRIITCETGYSETHLLFSKSRIIKPDFLTIPKLELVALILASRMLSFLRDALSLTFKRQFIWSDSQCALSWIKTDKIQPVYIQRRIDDLRMIENIQFHYLSTDHNPADIPSRGSSLKDLENSLWWSGPPWINFDSDWPPNTFEILDEVYLEPEITLMVAMQQCYQAPFGIQIESYSTYLRLLRTTASAISFLTKFSICDKLQSIESNQRPLSQAEFLWLKAEQKYHYFDIFEALEAKKKHKLVQQLGIFVDNRGLLRCSHRLQNSDLPTCEKNLILLPRAKDSYFVRLLIYHFHMLVYHQGTAYTLNALRREFWLPRGRASVSSTTMKCPACKRFTSRSYKQPDQSQLPYFRLKQKCKPFSYIGLDMCGPLIIEFKKRYILIITDLIIRAVELELLDDMTTEEILFAYRRFRARHSATIFFLSDNAKQFQLLESVLSATYAYNFVWKYIPAFSPWQGGVYERMIGIVKQAFLRTFHGQHLSDSAMRTSLAEIAAVLNSRPLTYVSEEYGDFPISPADLLHSNYEIPEEIVPPASTSVLAGHLVSLWKQGKEMADVFWKVWKSAYLQHLRVAKKHYNFPSQSTCDTPQVGVVVLIAEPHIKRHQWRLGRIIRLNLSEDGQIRSATLKIGNRSPGLEIGECLEVTRPLFHLYPLEVPEEEEEPGILQNLDESVEEEVFEIETGLDF